MVLTGSRKYKDQIREELQCRPLKFGDFSMMEKNPDMYLGYILSTNGLAGSVEATVIHRLGKVKWALYEAVAILKDYIIHSIGGMIRGWDIREKAIIPQSGVSMSI